MSDLSIVTYGGGEYLEKLFNAVALVFNGGNGGLIQPFCIIISSLGILWATIKAFKSSSAGSLIIEYLFPLMILMGFLMVPTSTVHVEDILKRKFYNIDNVPFLLAKFSELTSTLGYRLTQMMESVMHVSDEPDSKLKYSNSGMLFGAETALNISQYRITNGNLEQNMKQVAKQCILYDLALGKYSIDELKKTNNLWDFLNTNTSNVRIIPYLNPIDDKKANNGKIAQYETCKKALEKMEPLFAKEKNYYSQHEILKHLPLTFQALTGIQKNKEELIGQQLMMNVLSNEYSGKGFAKSRAQDQQRSIYQNIGSLASDSLVSMRAVLEAFICGVFIIIVPLCYLPGGLTYIKTWMMMTIWIQLWPPLYAILNYIMQVSAQSHAKSIFYNLSNEFQGLSIFTSIGLQNLNEDIHAMSGYLSMSIPCIAFFILQGGMYSINQLSGMLSSPAQSAGNSAATELSSGNYSLASTNFGQTHFQNSTAFQKNFAPSLSTGFSTINYGNYSEVHGQESLLKQNSSDFRTSVLSDDVFQNNLQKSYQTAQTHVEGAQKTFSDSISNHARSMTDITEHFANGKNFNQSISEREALDIQESARYMQSAAENWGSQHGISTRKSLETLVDAAIGFDLPLGLAGGHTKGQKSLGTSSDESSNSAFNIASSEEFQKHYQKVKDFSENQSFTSLSDEGARFVEGYTRSLEEVKSSQQQYQSAYNELNQVSDNLSWAESHSHSIKRSLNQDFMNWANSELAYEGGFSRAKEIITKGSQSERERLINSFATHLRSQSHEPTLVGFKDPSIAFQNSNVPSLNKKEEWNTIRSQGYSEAQEKGLSNESISKSENQLSHKFNLHKDNTKNQIKTGNASVSDHHEMIQKHVTERADKTLPSRLWSESNVGNFIKELVSGKTTPQNFSSMYQLKNKPFWYPEEK